jgi:hypothetical protein
MNVLILTAKLEHFYFMCKFIWTLVIYVFSTLYSEIFIW